MTQDTFDKLIKEIIELTIEQVMDQGWDLIDEFETNRDNAIQKVYDEIIDDIL